MAKVSIVKLLEDKNTLVVRDYDKMRSLLSQICASTDIARQVRFRISDWVSKWVGECHDRLFFVLGKNELERFSEPIYSLVMKSYQGAGRHLVEESDEALLLKSHDVGGVVFISLDMRGLAEAFQDLGPTSVRKDSPAFGTSPEPLNKAAGVLIGRAFTDAKGLNPFEPHSGDQRVQSYAPMELFRALQNNSYDAHALAEFVYGAQKIVLKANQDESEFFVDLFEGEQRKSIRGPFATHKEAHVGFHETISITLNNIGFEKGF